MFTTYFFRFASFPIHDLFLFLKLQLYYETEPLHIYHFVQHLHLSLCAFLFPELFSLSYMKPQYPIFLNIAQ